MNTDNYLQEPLIIYSPSPDLGIGSLDVFSPSTAIRSVDDLIENKAAQIKQETRNRIGKSLTEAEVTYQAIDAAAKETDSRYHEAEKADQKNRVYPDTWFVMVFALLSFFGCLTAEFYLTWNTLPYILGVKQHTFGGVMIAVSTTLAAAILKLVIATLIWDTWAERQAAPSLAGRIARCVVMAVFLLIVGWLNIHTIALLSSAREEAAKAKDSLRRGVLVEIRRETINRAILAVSICVAIDAALFYLIGLTELKKVTVWRSYRRRVKKLRREQEGLKEEQNQAKARLKEQQLRWEQVETQAENAAAAHRSHYQLQRNQALNRAVPIHEAVDRLLTVGNGLGLEEYPGIT